MEIRNPLIISTAFDDGSLAQSEPIVERNAPRALRESALFLRVAHLLSSDLAFNEILAHLLDLLSGLMPVDRVVVVEYMPGERSSVFAFPALDSADDSIRAYDFAATQMALQDYAPLCLTGAELNQTLGTTADGRVPSDIHSLAAAPLVQHGTVCGVLIVEAHHVTASFQETDLQVLGALALHLAMVLERDLAVLESRRRMDQMGAFSAVTSTVNEWVDVEQLARRFLSVFLNTTHTNCGLFYLVETEQEMRLVAHFGIPPELVEPLRVGYLAFHPDVKRAFAQGRLIVLDDLSHAAFSEAALEVAALIPIRATVVLPLRVKGRGMGVVALGSSEGIIEIPDREFVQGLADQAAQAIENARLFAESQRRFQEQSALRELAQRFLSAVTPDEVLERTLDALTSLLPGDYYEVLLPDAEPAFTLVNGRGWRRGVVGRTRTPGDPHLHAGYVLRAQLPVIVENFANETRFQPSDYLMRHQVVSGVCAPMLAETRVIGLLGVYSRAPREFSEEQSHFLYLVATQTAMALEKARHSQEAARRLDELILLNDVIAAANSQVGLDKVLASVSSEIRGLLQSDDVRIYFAQPSADRTVLLPALPSTPADARSAWSSAVAGWVVREGHPLLIQDLTRDLRFNVAGDQARACLGAPMTIGERVIGVVTVAHPEAGRYDGNDLRLLTTLAGQIAAAIERARLLDETATRLAEISAMFEFSDKVRTATTEVHLLDLILDDAVSMLQGDGGSLQLVLEDGNTMRVMAVKNMPHRGVDFVRSRGGLSWIAIDTGESLTIEDAATDPRIGFPGVFQNLHGGIVAPLRTPSGFLGTLFIGFEQRGAPSQDQVRLTTTIANLAAQALQRLRLHEQTVEQAASLAIALGDLEESYQATLLALSAALDARDRETEGHSQRVTKLALAIGRKLDLSPEDLTSLERGALLHDVGKIGISDNILRKTGPFTVEERALMNLHPQLGYEMLKGVPFLQDALPVVLYHQEMWDGSGYPKGLHGAEIPLGARIFAVADTYDAMTSSRPYRDALSHHEAVMEILRCRGTQFDPLVVDAFLALFDDRYSSPEQVQQ
ncbi:MAG: GAF domain-containing protein [Chloroflexi bacterium]|nr:GAF domain-containing protein [Chloroflexota bacterium]